MHSYQVGQDVRILYLHPQGQLAAGGVGSLHTLQVYQVKQWNEAQAMSVNRLYNTPWNDSYLALDGSDASPHAIGSATIFTSRPRGFVQIDVTEAMRNWQYGDMAIKIMECFSWPATGWSEIFVLVARQTAIQVVAHSSMYSVTSMYI